MRVRKNTSRRGIPEIAAFSKSAPTLARATLSALAADARSARYILFSYAGETASSLKYRAIPCSPRPRSISTERAHANIICESLAFRCPSCMRDTTESHMRVHGTRRSSPDNARRGERVRLVAVLQMDHCSSRWFDDHPRPNKTIETLRSMVPDRERHVGRLDLFDR